ncbi:MAG: class I SAM-dependent methyltransferase [Syntrophobacteraceae bacterium]
MSSNHHNTVLSAVSLHDSLAEKWDEKYSRRSFRNRMRHLLSMLDLTRLRDRKWLDAGCGSGILARSLAAHGSEVIGVDASPKMIEAARLLAKHSTHEDSLSFEVIETIEKLHFSDCAFDGIICSSVIEYLDNPAQAVSEFARVLKPQGLLLLSVPNKLSLLRLAERALYWGTKKLTGNPWLPYLNSSKNEYSLGSLGSLLGNSLSVKSSIYFGPLLPSRIGETKYGGSLIIVLAEKS